MQIVTSVVALREATRQWRQAGHSVGFVPTMGNLHAGHIKLVSTAKQQADKVVASIFVNPTQFGPNEDFASYPRTEQQDQEKLLASGADLLFLPAVTEMYPHVAQTNISVAALSSLHCGASRPGHFDGVALVVCKLLNMVQPDLLLLGEKDFQQLTLIRQMVADLNIPVTVQGVATVREDDGLAMSSRNGYLSEQQRLQAPMLYQALCAARDEILAGHDDYLAVAGRQRQDLQQAGFAVDYFSICRSQDLLPAGSSDPSLLILAAAKLGNTRLIDNLYFSKSSI
ncbi:pantoate--beta-alanine ligase [Methylomonas albis]|uniref:Pantothenate synthetase n=1 Tax=Methylomonas albis TaxID=1854563 RepID=A0ABR9CUM5_9GAMM|nr:pantoate--beta-alanine ligase [Methylomonas albis]MBD9354436.1 pantoate--beta-alanine ligase [Methylomonas albis]